MLRALLLTVGLSSISLLPALAFGAQAGKVVFVTGAAQLADKAVTVEQAVEEGDEISTGADGYVYVKTVDEGFLILRPNSKARVVAYQIDEANPANTRVKLELLQGVARSISGKGVKRARNNFRLNTPVAAIGVRGTDFIVYTNQQTSWVSVVSGGVVMSGFSGTCGPEGGGPCEGVTSRELFGGRADTMLQIQRGQSVPQLLQGGTVAPELSTPPRNDEPVGKVAINQAKVNPAVLEVINLEPVNVKPITDMKSTNNVSPDPGTGGGTNVPALPSFPQDPPLVVVEPEPAPLVKSEVMWGRWQPAAGNGISREQVARINAEGTKVQVLLGPYLIARPDNSAFVLPREGTAGFALTGGEAVLAAKGGTFQPAKVENGSLNIDFAKRTYTTAISVVNAQGQANLSSYGDITKTGTMVNSFMSPGMTVRGVLGGTNANEAVYSFKTPDDADVRAQGITTWNKKR
ncbi:FecR family protein [Pseudoduganella albidiflava]|nr:FecR family protein [Pseudoduganella albidiflava]GGY54986.1 hypothetical protein GCM10007387_41780 [Pseudoduganella albidiflava]